MKIGYSVEGSTDRGLLKGLQRRWCPDAELIEGKFRGTSGQSQRREIPNTCLELAAKGVEAIIFLRDANDEAWREVIKADESRCRLEQKHIAIFGVCARNAESWLCCDADWIASQTEKRPEEFRVPDPKGVFESALKITATDKKEAHIADLVERAPLRNWLANPSFEEFYARVWHKSKEVPSCKMENLREKSE